MSKRFIPMNCWLLLFVAAFAPPSFPANAAAAPRNGQSDETAGDTRANANDTPGGNVSMRAPGNNAPASANEEAVDICKLPPMQPNATIHCAAYFIRWTYNATQGKCVDYVYGGCYGTANLFENETACQAACHRSPPPAQSLSADNPAKRELVANDGPCDSNKCSWGLWEHYKFLNCRPVYEDGACCPTRYVCPPAPAAQGPGCLYKGVQYAIGDPMPAVTDEDPCQAECLCTEDYGSRGSTRVTCAQVECPDVLGAPGTMGCRRIYDKPNQCCASSYRCNVTSSSNVDFLCEYDGHKYLEGERIYPSREVGKTCVCNKAFKEGGISSSACIGYSCGWETTQQGKLARGCTPVYYGQGGCPIDWVCPGDKGAKVDGLSTSPSDGLVNEGAMTHDTNKSGTAVNGATSTGDSLPCTLGQETFNVGSGFLPASNACYQCRCSIPPMLTCQQTATSCPSPKSAAASAGVKAP